MSRCFRRFPYLFNRMEPMSTIRPIPFNVWELPNLYKVEAKDWAKGS